MDLEYNGINELKKIKTYSELKNFYYSNFINQKSLDKILGIYLNITPIDNIYDLTNLKCIKTYMENGCSKTQFVDMWDRKDLYKIELKPDIKNCTDMDNEIYNKIKKSIQLIINVKGEINSDIKGEINSNIKNLANIDIDMKLYDDIKQFMEMIINSGDLVSNSAKTDNILISLALKFGYYEIMNNSYLKVIDELLKTKNITLGNLEYVKAFLTNLLYIENIEYFDFQLHKNSKSYEAKVIFNERNVHILYNDKIETMKIKDDGIINLEIHPRSIKIGDITFFTKDNQREIVKYYSNVNDKVMQDIKTNIEDTENIDNVDKILYNKIQNYIKSYIDNEKITDGCINVDSILTNIALKFGYYNVMTASYLKSITEILGAHNVHIGDLESVKNCFENMIYINKDIILFSGSNMGECKVVFYNKIIGVLKQDEIINETIKLHNGSIYINARHIDKIAIGNVVFFTKNKENKERIVDYYERINKKIQQEVNECIPLIIENINNVSNDCKVLIKNYYNYFPEDILLNKQAIMAFEYSISFDDPYVSRISEINKSTMDSTNINVKLYNKINLIKENSYYKFVQVMGKNVSLNEKLHSSLVWELIKKHAISHFAQIWENEYGSYFSGVLEQPIEDISGIFCRISELNNKDVNTVGKFTYYLMFNNKFNNSNYNNFLECNNIVINCILKECKRIELENFENKLTKQIYKKINYTIDDVDLMTGLEFEEFVSKLFEKMGFSVRVTKSSGDQGVDVLAEKNGNKIGIQAKCYSGSVGNKAVQEVVAGVKFYNCDKGIVVTNNWYTNSAIELAEANNIVLWDRNMLKQKIEDIMNR